MKFLSLKNWCCFLLTGFLSFAAFSETYKLLPANYSGVSEDTLDLFTELLRTNILNKNQIDEKSLNGLQPGILKVSDGILLTLEKHKGSKAISIKKVKIRDNEQLEEGTKTLVALLDSRDAKDIVDLSKTKGGKNQMLGFYAGFGPAKSMGIGANNKFYAAGDIGVHLNFSDFRVKIFAQNTSEITNSENSSGENHLGVGIDYFLSNLTISPFVGIDMALGDVSTSYLDPDGSQVKLSGFSFAFNGGYEFLRHETFSFTAQAFLRPVLTTIRGHFAAFYGAQIGISMKTTR